MFPDPQAYQMQQSNVLPVPQYHQHATFNASPTTGVQQQQQPLIVNQQQGSAVGGVFPIPQQQQPHQMVMATPSHLNGIAPLQARPAPMAHQLQQPLVFLPPTQPPVGQQQQVVPFPPGGAPPIATTQPTVPPPAHAPAMHQHHPPQQQHQQSMMTMTLNSSALGASTLTAPPLVPLVPVGATGITTPVSENHSRGGGGDSNNSSSQQLSLSASLQQSALTPQQLPTAPVVIVAPRTTQAAGIAPQVPMTTTIPSVVLPSSNDNPVVHTSSIVSGDKSEAASCFVAGLPFHYTETMLKELFSDCGEITGTRVLLSTRADKAGQSRGCGFVHFNSSEGASTAINRLHNAVLQDLKGASKRILVTLADKTAEFRSEDSERLFIRHIPASVSRAELAMSFGKFGTVVGSEVMPDTSIKGREEAKGTLMGYVTMSSVAEGVAAMKSADNTNFFGEERHAAGGLLIVKPAETMERRNARRQVQTLPKPSGYRFGGMGTVNPKAILNQEQKLREQLQLQQSQQQVQHQQQQ